MTDSTWLSSPLRESSQHDYLLDSAKGDLPETRRICVAYTHPQGKVAQQAPRCCDLEERTPIRPCLLADHAVHNILYATSYSAR